MSPEKGSPAEDRADEIRIETQEMGPVQREVRVTVAQVRVRKAFERAYRDLGRQANVKGFRKGKVPRSVLEKLYGASVPEEIERILVNETLRDAVELAGVVPVVEPQVEAEPPSTDADFEYTLRVEIKPEIELPALDALVGKRPRVDVSEETVDERLENLREQNAPLVEEPEGTLVAEGHTITFDYSGSIDGETFAGGAAEGADLEIGSGRMMPGFEDQLVGAKPGENVTLKVHFPDDYGVDELNGKDAEFSCLVHTIRKKAVPDLDDEFAKDVGDFETIDALKNKIRSDLVAGREREADHVLRRSVIESLLSQTEFEVPPGVVERQLHSQIENMRRQFAGQMPEEILQQQLARMHEEGRENAEKRVREAYVLEVVAGEQEFSVDEDEVKAHFADLAAAQGMDADTLEKMADQQGWKPAIEAELLDKKALDFLVSKATVEEESEEDSEASR